MGIRTKPRQPSASAPTDEHHINALIEKGGSVASATSDPSRHMLVQLRLPHNLIQKIDQKRKTRLVPPSRHAWILEALLEKLEASE